MPQVSIIIPTYNRAHFIKQAVESALIQTYQDFELIVVDDGSTDDTKQVLADYAGRLQYIYQPNQGRSAARNRGIELAQGEYIAFLDSDDLWLPNKLSRQVPALDTAPDNVALVHGYKQIVDEKLNPIPLWETRLRRYYALAEKGQETYENYLHSACIFTSTILIRKSALVAIGNYDTTLYALEDLDLYLRLLLKSYTFTFISEPPLIKYRSHNNNTDNLTSNQHYLRVYEKHLSQCCQLEDEKQVAQAQTLLYQALASTYYRLGSYHQARDYWHKAFWLSWKTGLHRRFWRQYPISWLRSFAT